MSESSHRGQSSDDVDHRTASAGNASAPAHASVATRRLLSWAQAVGRLRLRAGSLWRSRRPGASRSDERRDETPRADSQPRVGITPLDPTPRRHLARLRHMAHVARMTYVARSVARAGTPVGRFARWSVPAGRRGATWWRLGEVRRWRERRMQRLYTLRELFQQGIRGQADLHDAIQHGDPLTRRVATLAAFWVKINNDWIFNLSGLLAYNFLFAIFPILILVLAITGFVLSNIAPGTETLATDNIVRALPAGIGSVIVEAVSARLKASAGGLLVVGLVTALFAGSRLFITLENCFGVVFRLRSRDPIGQNRMAFALLLVYLVLLPLLLGTLLLPAGVEQLFDPSGRDTLGSVLVTATGVLMALLSATVLFTLIYARVPYRQRPWRSFGPNWRGAVVAAALLLLYELVFPLYTTFILNPSNYGTIAGFAVVILVFFYYLAFILLLGAEINSWVAGQRETASDVPGILHAVQAHRSTRGAAGPTAGAPQEEMQPHLRS
jgi:YihY family inner membrane protein